MTCKECSCEICMGDFEGLCFDCYIEKEKSKDDESEWL